MATIFELFPFNEGARAEAASIILSVKEWLEAEKENLLEDLAKVEMPSPGGMPLVDMTSNELEARSEILKDRSGRKLAIQQRRHEMAKEIALWVFDRAISAASGAILSRLGGSE